LSQLKSAKANGSECGLEGSVASGCASLTLGAGAGAEVTAGAGAGAATEALVVVKW